MSVSSISMHTRYNQGGSTGPVTKEGKLRGYAKQSQSSGVIKCATLGNFQRDYGYTTMDLTIATANQQLLLQTTEGPGTQTNHTICDTLLFSNVLDIQTLRVSFLGYEGSDLCVVLGGSGILALFFAQRVQPGAENDQVCRWRVLEQTMVAQTRVGNGLDPVKVLRRVSVDPLVRALAVVSWVERIELVLLKPQQHQHGGGGVWADVVGQTSILGARVTVDVGGLVCDAALLAPRNSERQRILLVAAVVEKTQNIAYLHLYESWTTKTSLSSSSSSSMVSTGEECSMSLVARLPLPSAVSAPMHIVPLPDLPECFLLISETFVALFSAPQILSGDVNLYGVSLPTMADGCSDLVRAFCVAGTITPTSGGGGGGGGAGYQLGGLRRSPSTLSPGQFQQEQIAQKVYLTLQSGTLYMVSAVASPPSVTLTCVAPAVSSSDTTQLMCGEAMVYLGTLATRKPPRSVHQDSPTHSPDLLFVSGECTDHRIVKVSWEGNENLCMPVWSARVVLANQSPMLDMVLRPKQKMLYWTSGRDQSGAVHRVQLGHHAQVEESVGFGGAAVTRLWTFNVHVPGSSGSTYSCVVMRQAETLVSAARDTDGEWQVLAPLQVALEEQKSLIYIGCEVKESGWLVYVFADRVCLAESIGMFARDSQKVHTLTVFGGCEDSLETFTHAEQIFGINGSWVVLATRSVGAEPCISVVELPTITDRLNPELNRVSGTLVTRLALGPNEVSALRVLRLGSLEYVCVATYAPKVLLYRFDHERRCLVQVLVADIEPVLPDLDCCDTAETADDMDVADRGSGQVVSDVYLLSTRNKALLVVGMRDGTLMQFEIPESQALNDLAQPTDGLKQLSCESVVRVGSVPVRFAPIPQAHRLGNLEQDSANQSRNGGESSTSRVLVYAESMHIAELTEFGQAKITPCTGIDCGGTLVHNVCQVATIADSMDTTSQGGSGIFRCFASISPISTDSDSALLGAINLLNIKLEAQCHVREYLVGSDPRRILCDDDSGMIIVAGVQRGRQQMDEFPQCSLDILDPSSGLCTRGAVLAPNEQVHALTAWHITGPKLYKYMCLGTGIYPKKSSEPLHQPVTALSRAVGGRIIIYSLKAPRRKAKSKEKQQGEGGQLDNSTYALRHVWESRRQGPVTALVQLGGPYLLVAAGNTCIVLKLDVVQRKLIECCELELRFAITSLDVLSNGRILAGSQRETTHVLQFTRSTDNAYVDGSESLKLLHSARFGLCTTGACFVAPNLAAGVDTLGYVYFMNIPRRSAEFALDFAMGLHLGVPCSGVAIGTMVYRLGRPKHVLPWENTTGLKQEQKDVNVDQRVDADGLRLTSPVDYLMVYSVSGALWTVLRISEQAYSLLAQLERAMLDMPDLHPARPLLAAGRSVSRINNGHDIVTTPFGGRVDNVMSEGIIDATLATVFLEALTCAEQREVVESSPELMRLALELQGSNAQNKRRSGSTGVTDSVGGAVDAVRQLVSELNSTSVC